MPARRRFGKVRKLPSGKFQASFIGPNGLRQNAPQTFRTKTDADRWLVKVEADISRGAWLDEKLGRQRFEDYAKAYLRENSDVGPRWEETCLRNMRLHMTDLLDRPLVAITAPVVRTWHANALAGKGGRTSIQQSYRFLRAVMNQAKRDGAIMVNPCSIKGAGTDRAKERSIANVEDVAALVEAIYPRYRAAVLLAAWCGLRRGEIIGLNVVDVDLVANVVQVRRNWVELLESDEAFEADPKTDAGARPVAIPPHLRPYLIEHREQWAGPVWMFVGRDGQRMRGNAIYQAFVRARNKVGVSVTFHDLRHTGQSLAALTGANLADLKKRLGHSSNAAASRYLHAVDGRDREVADELSRIAARGNAAELPRRIVVKH
ncbi:tyrosine-type recombinase/integrase [Nocardia sp. NPDC057353]|uniref:tyrosine-type recombinase/integrase n=1 Tax=Nocardia sp. NPDC057353 TaxID=3346104 RepID=UPI003641259C